MQQNQPLVDPACEAVTHSERPARAGVDLIEYLRARIETEPDYRAIVLAHPCSGTTWLCDVLNDIGIPANHELERPADAEYRVLVTYRTLGFAPLRPGTDRVHLVRDPARVVESAAALFVAQPRIARDVVAQILQDGLSINTPAVGSAGPLALAAWTLSVFNQRAEAFSNYRFRIEDVSENHYRRGVAGAHRRVNSHTRGKPAQGLRWEDVPAFRDLLGTQRRRYGYAVV